MGPSGRRGRGTFAVKLHAVTLRQPDYTSVAINELGFTVHSLPIVATLRGSAFWALPGPRKAASWFRKKAGGGSMFLLPGLKYKGNAMLSISILLYFDEIDSTKNCGLHLPAVYTMCHKRKGLTVLGSFPKSCFQSLGFVVCLASVFLHGLAAAEAMPSPLSPGPRRAPWPLLNRWISALALLAAGREPLAVAGVFAGATNATSTRPNRVLNPGLPSLCPAAQLAP